jgi:DNA-binding protein HU-beta
MRKSELVNAVYDELEKEHTKQCVSDVVEKVFKTIREEVADGGYVAIRGFGTFRWFKSKPRKAVNIEGEDVIVPAKETMKFKASDSVFE